MTYIASIETATKVCSVAIHNNGELCAFREMSVDRSHSGDLVPMLSQTLHEVGIAAAELSAVSVSMGPGSYTGLRIGVSTAKGLCYSHNLPLIAINTLEAMAAGIENDADLLVPMIDARRMEVYCSVFDQELNTATPTEAKIINEESFHEILDRSRLVFFGNGASKCQPMITHSNAEYDLDFEPSARFQGELGYAKFLKNDFEDLANFEPFYLKEFQGTKPKAVK